MALRTASRSQYLSKQTAAVIVRPSAAVLAAREDVGAFGAYVAGKEPAPIHRSWFPHLQTEQHSECLNRIAGQNTNILSFRGSAKTTWLRIWLAWAIGHNPHLQVGWISFTEKISIKSSRWIKRLIVSDRYKEVFPNIRPGSQWSDMVWAIDWQHAGVSEFDQDFTFASLGITGGITSNRFHLTVFDDLIKSAKAIKNEEIRDAMRETYGEVIEPCIEAVPGSRQISLGTRFRGDDIHCTEFVPHNGWKVIEQGAIIKDDRGNEKSAWEERIPLTKLQRLRDRRPVIFSYQWMNVVPPLSDEYPITEDDIQWFEDAELKELTFPQLVLGIDLAASEEERNNATAFILAGRKDNKIYLLEWDEFRISGNMRKIDRVMALWKKWQHKATRLTIAFGKPAYQKSFEGDFKDFKLREKKQKALAMRVRCDALPENLDKFEKLESISGVFQDKQVFMLRSRSWGRVIAQLIGADQDEDDLADACYFAIGHLQGRIRRKITGA